jgi:hypothetical protein
MCTFLIVCVVCLQIIQVFELTTGQPVFDLRQREGIFPLASVSRPTQARPASYPMVPGGVLSPVVNRSRGVTLTAHPHLVSKSRMIVSCIPLPLVACMAVAGRFYFYELRYIIDSNIHRHFTIFTGSFSHESSLSKSHCEICLPNFHFSIILP